MGPGFAAQLRHSITGREIFEADWDSTSLGEISTWPSSFRALVSAVLACPTAMFLAWGPDLRTFFNDAYRPILGQRASNIMGIPLAELWHDNWSEISPLVARALSGEGVEMVDMRLDLHRAGVPEESWWTFSYSPVRDDDGDVSGLLCVTRETTERVLALKARSSATERLRAALSAGDTIGSWDWDVVNDRITADERFALIYNVDPDLAAVGTSLSEFTACIHPDDLPLVRAQIDATLRFGDAYLAEYRILGAHGVIHWVSAQGSAVFDETGNCVRFPGISFDITVNKQIELAAATLKNTLE
ncbi:PAS domain-containing protein [Novosphingobium sp. AP12]|uniref:PAS domain-containing protein n=1 Tax=Novosphingobium sp. AP12 TaxID=1144305 RepID=UPI0002721A57|nr:PAS domain-containing protein [Novosphingobium sp. AP12]EJL22172.1 PAS domain S-box [Novosphingobium sp. AP12]